MQIPLKDQIACVKREIAMRSRVYPKRIAMDFMSPVEASIEIARMTAVLCTLEQLDKPIENQLDLIPRESEIEGTPV